jgi:hypothetical protein
LAACDVIRVGDLQLIRSSDRQEATMTTRVVPPGYTRVRTLKPTTYAREEFLPGELLIVDDDTANRLVTSKHAEVVAPDPARAMITTSCPKCGSAMAFVAEPEPHERWTACQNPACLHGWLR